MDHRIHIYIHILDVCVTSALFTHVIPKRKYITLLDVYLSFWSICPPYSSALTRYSHLRPCDNKGNDRRKEAIDQTLKREGDD